MTYPADFALAAVRTNNHQVANVSSPENSEHIRALSFFLLPLEQDTLLYFLIDSVSTKPFQGHMEGKKKPCPRIHNILISIVILRR